MAGEAGRGRRMTVFLLALLLAPLAPQAAGAARKRHKKKREESPPAVQLPAADACEGPGSATPAALVGYGDKFYEGGLAARRGDLLRAAIGCYERVLLADPDAVQAHVGLGNVKVATGDNEGAYKDFRRGLRAARPGEEGPALLGMGSLEVGVQSMLPDAEKHLTRACELMPGSARARYYLGLSQTYQHRYEEAADSYRAAVAIDPADTSSWGNLGGVLFGAGELDGAVEAYERARSLQPGDQGVASNLANALAKAGRWARAAQAFSDVLKLSPGDEVAVARRHHVRHQGCDWSAREADERAVRRAVRARLAKGDPPLVTPFDALSMDLFSTADLLGVARAEARSVAEKAGAVRHPPRPLTVGRARCVGGVDARLPGDRARSACRLRVGYVSSDFREHPVGYIMHHLMRLHDSGKFEVFAYAINPENDSKWRAVTARGVEHFVDIHDMDPKAAAERIRGDQIDLLVNLNGYTKSARNGIFSFAPAPVQVLFCGYAGSMGSETVQYLVGDSVSTPPPSASHLDERLILMPHAYLPVDHAISHPDLPNQTAPGLAGAAAPAGAGAGGEVGREAPRRADYGLPEEAFVLCCFNTHYKMDPQVFGAWMNVLARAPGSVLWLAAAGEDTARVLRAEAAAAGVHPGRLVFASWFPEAEHLRIKSLCSVFVDTPAYNAHVTGADALWAGVPLLTLPGDKMAARVGASAVSAVGLEELAVSTFRAYEDRLVRLARAPGEYARLRARVAAARLEGPLFDLPGYVRGLERAWAAAWELHAAGAGPRPLRVAPPPPLRP